MKLHLSLLSIAMLCATSAQASTVDLQVQGTIVPASCTIGLTNGGVINLGRSIWQL